MNTIYLVRHGETAHNAGGRGLGREDAPLTAAGRAQAQEVANRFANLPLGVVLSSPLRRARDAAELIVGGGGLEVEVMDDLIELDVGTTEGMSFAEMRQRFPEFMRDWAAANPIEVCMPGGERLADLAERTDRVVKRLRAADGINVAVVSHNFVIKIMLCQLLDLPLENFRRFQVDLASVSTVTVRNGRAAVAALNDTCHIETLSLA
ncbi:MAG TPA: histidine phosphatase family protein [Tepidiformaceae bacterium]|nr:histidine phosphatase family protein [Tepidiformaceae bacterium]